MTVSKRTAVMWWVGGLIAFVITIFCHTPLITDMVPGGIGEHQNAPDAVTVDAIQQAWRSAGVLDAAKIAMMMDLVFIGVFGVGCVLAGIHYRARTGILRLLGWGALVSGVIFLITDYGETTAQFIQLTQFAGDDDLAGLASTLSPIKMVTWLSGFLTVLIALIVDRFSSSTA